MKALRKAKRTVTRSIHQALHHKIEEEQDFCKSLKKAVQVHGDGIQYTRAWAETCKEDADLCGFVENVAVIEERWNAALAMLLTARQEYVEAWQSILEKERERDTAKKRYSSAENALEKAKNKMNKAQSKANFETKRNQLNAAIEDAERELDNSLNAFQAAEADCEQFTRKKLGDAARSNAEAHLALCENGTTLFSEQLVSIDRFTSSSGNTASYMRTQASAGAAAVTSAAAAANPFGSGGGSGGASAVQTPADAGNPFGDANADAADAGGAEEAVAYRAIATFEGETEEELSFQEGQTVYVTDILDDDWVYGYLGDAYGAMPISFLEKA